MDRNLTAIEVIGLAIRSEEEASKFYGALSKRVKNDLVKAKYEQLAREEAGHRLMLLSEYKRQTGDTTPPPRIPGSPEVAEGGDADVESASIEELIQLAIDRERKASAFYAEAAEGAADHSGRSLLLYLADVERGHEVGLTIELEAYRRDSNWYADNPDIQLVGP